jgi:hypothetical protein
MARPKASVSGIGGGSAVVISAAIAGESMYSARSKFGTSIVITSQPA